MAGHTLGFIAEIHPILVIAPDLVLAQEIVRVLVANRDPIPSVPFQYILFEQPMLHSPAQEQAILAVVPGNAAAHRRTLRTAARMQSQPSVAFADALLN